MIDDAMEVGVEDLAGGAAAAFSYDVAKGVKASAAQAGKGECGWSGVHNYAGFFCTAGCSSQLLGSLGLLLPCAAAGPAVPASAGTSFEEPSPLQPWGRTATRSCPDPCKPR